MSAVVKAHPIKMTFKAPRKIVAEIKSRYGRYIVRYEDNEDASVDITQSAWYRDMEKKMAPGKYLKTLREIRGLTLREVGEKAGASPQRVSDWEKGSREISKEAARRLAELFGVSPAVFI